MSNDVPPFQLIERRTGTDLGLLHLTAVARRPVEDEAEIAALFRSLADAVANAGGQVLQEKVFASRTGIDAIERARDAAGSDVPPTVVVAEPCLGGFIAGVQLLALTGEGRCDTVHDGGAAVGRLWEGDGLRVLALAGVHGPPDAAVPDQMDAMFALAGARVEAGGFEFHQVARTWIYVEPLLRYYEDLNRSRDEFFHGVGRRSPERQPPPASTGIQGGHPLGAACHMDVVALSGDDRLDFSPMRTSHQCEAYDYGSAFSRGMTVRFGADRLLYASGTASIDEQGRTVHVGDAEAQNRETFAAVDTLLRHQEASFVDVVTGVLFFKQRRDLDAWRALRDRGEVPDFPAIAVFADVCRDDLLFELEVTAVG